MGGHISRQAEILVSIQEQDVFSVPVPTQHCYKDIQYKEMRAISHALQLWLDQLQGQQVILYCDNEDCVYGLQKSSICGSAMSPLQQIAMLMATHDVIVIPTWIPTKENQLADDLSRFRYQKVADTYPQLRCLNIPKQN